ncbi:hypothetical protein, partial [Kribbella sp. DT2]|uniref:hypothetical protein n=1 Tax=Kribbella sp. DT2 TaxID=3393427 RepID=UPI003CE7EC49
MASIEEEVFMDLYHAVKGAMRGVRRTFALARRLLRGRRRDRQAGRAPQIDAPGGSGPSNNGPQVDERVVEEQQDRRLDLHERRAMTEAVLVHLRNHPEHRAQLDSLTDVQRRELMNGLIDRALADDELGPDPSDLDGDRIPDARERDLADRERDLADREVDRAVDAERETTEAEGTAEAAERKADEAEQTAEDREKTREAEAREEDGERREGPDAADAVPAAAVVAAEGLDGPDAGQPEAGADRDGQNQPETAPQAEADQDGRGADEPVAELQAEADRASQGVDEATAAAEAEAARDGQGVNEPAAELQ